MHKNPSEESHSQTTKKDSQIAECTVVLKGGAIVHTSERSEDMYASIDLVSHKLAQKLRRHKEKVQSKRRNEKVSQFYIVLNRYPPYDISYPCSAKMRPDFLAIEPKLSTLTSVVRRQCIRGRGDDGRR